MNEAYLTSLRTRLTTQYTPGQGGQGGHDIGHILRMVRMYDELLPLIEAHVNRTVYEVTVWLHNVDRYPELIPYKYESVIVTSLHVMLKESGFDERTQYNIVTAILEHGKYKDDPEDSALLRMLRLADKWDRIGYMGAVSGFAWRGNELPAYDPQKPFGYGSTAEGSYTNLYQNLFRIMEWYADFELIRVLCARHPWRFENFLAFVRGFAAEIADAHGVPNTVEDDIRKCLGMYYGMR